MASEEILDNEIQQKNREIAYLRKKFPEKFLMLDFIYIKILGKAYPVGIFMCNKCSRPISHQQFMWSKLCAGCDLGREEPKWRIEKPDKYKMVDRLLKE